MKDGFDKNVAEKMPRMQKIKPNRPWNVDPVLIKTQAPEDETVNETVAFVAVEEIIPEMPVSAPSVEAVQQEVMQPIMGDVELIIPAPEVETVLETPVMETPMAVQPESVNALKSAENTIEEINSQFTNMLMERRDAQRNLEQRQQALNDALQQNTTLQALVASLREQLKSSEHLRKEVVFLSEQLLDADHYIQNLVAELDWKNRAMEEQQSLRTGLEEKYLRVTGELKGMATLDVKVSILERDLSAAQGRVHELENLLEEETQKRVPLEEEIVELKAALDRVHTSLSQIRLKAKREAYGL